MGLKCDRDYVNGVSGRKWASINAQERLSVIHAGKSVLRMVKMRYRLFLKNGCNIGRYLALFAFHTVNFVNELCAKYMETSNIDQVFRSQW